MIVALLLAATLTWTAPVCTQDSPACAPAGCDSCFVLYVPRKVRTEEIADNVYIIVREWWEQPMVVDTLARLPASDGQAMGWLMPLWVGHGTAIVVCRDSAGNVGRHSNYVPSRTTE